MRKILLLEDDAELRREIAEALLDEQFDVRETGTVRAFWAEYTRFEPDALILDMKLPDGKGLDIVREVRASSMIGILFLSGRLDEVERILALEMGADEFVVKPCSPRELIARVNAVLRRCDPLQQAETGRRVASFAEFRLDLVAMELTDPRGELCPLTTAEFALLKAFVERPHRVISREALLDLIRGDGWAGYDRTIDGLISRLRRKLATPGGRSLFRTVRGAGYMFTADVH